MLQGDRSTKGIKLLSSRPGRFTAEERSSGIHWIWWVGPSASLQAVGKREIPCPSR